MNRPIRILIHGMTGNLGGIESCIMNYYRNINPEIIHIDFLCINAKPVYYQEITGRGDKVYIIPGRRKFFTLYRSLIYIFKENKYDVLWSNQCTFQGTSLLLKIAFKQSIPFRIVHAHSTGNVGYRFGGRLMHTIEKLYVEKYATEFWACSLEAGEYFYRKNVLNSINFKIINNAINADMYKFNKNIRDITRELLCVKDKFLIGHIGRFSAEKNHNFLIRIFQEIYRKEPNTVLLLVGEGKLRSKIEKMVKLLNLSEAVRFLGIRSDIPALLSAMDIFVFPSKFEGLSLSLIEAQAAGLYSFTSTTVSSETAITNFISFIDLKKTPEQWADIILSKRNYDRYDMTEEIQKAGFDIKTEAIKIEQYLYNAIRKQV